MFRTALASLTSITLLAAAPAYHANASEGPNVIVDSDHCHFLMTDNECRMFKDVLARISNGAERQRFLERQARLLRDREKACGCRVAGFEAAKSQIY